MYACVARQGTFLSRAVMGSPLCNAVGVVLLVAQTVTRSSSCTTSATHGLCDVMLVCYAVKPLWQTHACIQWSRRIVGH